MRVRGLKHYKQEFDRDLLASHPVRVRGLKQKICVSFSGGKDVAPRAGAWVET